MGLLSVIACSACAVFVAEESGGALFNVGSLAVNSTLFAENSATEGGLAIMNGDTDIQSWNVTFRGNALICMPDEYSDFEDVRTVRWQYDSSTIAVR